MLRTALAAWFLLATLAAQRAPCTGTFTDPTGAPLAAATVTFVQEISQTLGLEGDRVAVETNERGEFTAELLRGSPYAVWAIGPADEHGARWLTGLSLDGAGGKRLALTAERRAAPGRVVLQGVSVWKAHCPPALRVLVGGYYALGHDLPLAGDGPVTFGPVPDRAAVLALVDDKRAVRCYSGMVDDGSETASEPTVAFDPPHSIECEVKTSDGEPVADVVISAVVHRPQWWVPEPGPLPCAIRDLPTPLARTDANGRATVQVRWADAVIHRGVTLIATHPGSAASVSGYSAHHRFCHFAPADGDGPLWFQIDRGGDWQLRVAARDGDRVQYLLLDSALDFRVTHGIGSGRLPLPATFHDGTMRALVPANCQRGELQVRLAPGAAAPPAMVLLTAEVRGDTEIDLASLTRVTLNVRGAGGEPVPFAQVAFGMRRRSLLERWMGNCVADESGRVDALVTPGASDLFAVAWADGAFGAAGVEIGDEPAEVAVVIAPLPHTDLHVVDAAGAPVSGARIAPDVQARALGDVDEDTALELCAAQQCCFALAMHARSGADGLLRIPIAAGWLSDVVIGGRGLRSEQFRLAVGRSREVVLR